MTLSSRFFVSPVIVLLLLTGSGFVSSAVATPVFINELHYDNSGADQSEGFEIAGPADTDLNGWQLVLYNGGNGEPYSLLPLAGIIPDLSGGFGVLSFSISGIQNGAPDGVALVDHTDQVRQFLSYEGVFTAITGVAAGLTSLDIDVFESSSAAVATSLQLFGAGQFYEDFQWRSGIAQSFGQINAGQSLAGEQPGHATIPVPSTALLCLFMACLLVPGIRETGSGIGAGCR